MNLIESYNKALRDLYAHVGFKESWVVCPIDDCTKYYWDVDDERVFYADTEAEFDLGTGRCYEDEIFKQVHYDKWVYVGADFTMIFCNPYVDGVKWFRVFDNSKRRVK